MPAPGPVILYLSDLDAQTTAGVLTLDTATMDTPIYEFAVDISVPKTDLNLFNYTLNNENFAIENPNAQDISITFPDYPTTAFIDLNNYGDYSVDRASGQNNVISAILSTYSNVDENGLILLSNVAKHFGHPKILSIFSDENTVKFNLKGAINTAFTAKVASNATALTADFPSGSSPFVLGDNATANTAVKSLLKIIQTDSTRLAYFQEQNTDTAGFADLLKAGDIIQSVVQVFENSGQLNLNGSTPQSQVATKMLVRINVIDAAP